MNASMVEGPDRGTPQDHIAQPIPRAPRRKSQRNMDLESFGSQIADYRKAAHLSQEQLAKKAGVCVDTVEHVEAGAVGASYDTLYRFSKVLKRTIRIKAS